MILLAFELLGSAHVLYFWTKEKLRNKNSWNLMGILVQIYMMYLANNPSSSGD